MPEEDEQQQPEPEPQEPELPDLGAHPESPLPQPIQFEQLKEFLQEEVEKNVDRFDDVPLTVSIELGRVAQPIRQILEWKEGSVVETKKLSGQPMEIMVNGRLIGRGEVVVVGDNLAIRITDLEKPDLS